MNPHEPITPGFYWLKLKEGWVPAEKKGAAQPWRLLGSLYPEDVDGYTLSWLELGEVYAILKLEPPV